MILCPGNMWAIRINLPNLIFCKLSVALWRQRGERKESLQLLGLWNLNFTSSSLVAPRRLSCEFSAHKREAETSANVNKHWKTSAKGNDIITNVISANQHFASTFSMRTFKFQGRSCKLFFLYRPAARALRGTCLQAIFFVKISATFFWRKTGLSLQFYGSRVSYSINNNKCKVSGG